jgi:hypothetical protein
VLTAGIEGVGDQQVIIPEASHVICAFAPVRLIERMELGSKGRKYAPMVDEAYIDVMARRFDSLC